MERNTIKEFNKKSSKILNKAIKAFEKLENEYTQRIAVISLIRQEADDSWNTVISSGIKEK